MRELLKKDITIKAVSILFALILWFVVNPVETRSLVVPLNIINESSLKDKDIVLKNSNYKRTVEVIIRGRKEKVDNLSGNDFQAILDFSRVKSADDSVVSIDGPHYMGRDEGISIESVLPSTVNIQLEKIKKEYFPVEVEYSGNLAANYSVIDIGTQPETVLLKGVESLVDTVDSVKASINVTNFDRDRIVTQNCVVYDRNGNQIDELSKDLTTNISVKVGKEVPVIPVYKGKISQNYSDGPRTVNPGRVLISGPYEVLSKIDELNTEPINIGNVNESTDLTAALVLPEGVKLISLPKEVTVSVSIEPLFEKEFVIDRNVITLINNNSNSNFDFAIQTENLRVSIKGPKTELENLDVAALKPTIDLAGLGEGTRKVPLILSLPLNSHTVQSYEVEVLVQQKPPVQNIPLE